MATSPPPNSKETVYIDIDDEITGIIDKLRTSEGKIVALVLPKRATVFQSIVNMKLLKRAADDSKKNIVLITSEAGLLPLAGVAGIHVAKTLNSKPEIPLAPTDDSAEETINEDPDEPLALDSEDEAVDTTKPVGELAGLTSPVTDDVETIELDDDEAPEDATDGAPLATKDFKAPKPKKDSKLRIPNFERFRLLLIIGGLLLIVIIAGLIFAVTALPKATIAITTDATNVNANINLSLSTTVSSLDTTSNAVPAKLSQQTKTYTQQVTTTGQKNEGQKATGQMTVVNCTGDSVALPAGTGLSSGNYTFISQNSVVVPDSNYTKDGTCKNDGKNTVNVEAQSGGSAYNLASGATYTIAGQGSSLTGTGTAMSGGTDNNVQVVSQSDIDNAKSKITTNDSSVKQALQNQLQQSDYYPIAVTYNAATPTTTNSANVGDAANSVTVTETIVYGMFGVHQSDLKTLVDNNVKNQIDTSKQSILSEGLDTANYTVQNQTATGAQITLAATATAGPQLDEAAIKAAAAGKKSGDLKAQLQANPDVTGVNVKLSPFFVTSIPKKTSRITVTIAKPTTTAGAANSNTANSNASNP